MHNLFYSKDFQTRKRRIKPNQRQKGSVNAKVRLEVKERSNGVCERCNSKRASQMAHITSRKQIDHVTTAKDLLHLCIECHIWLDQTEEGINYKRRLENENHTLDIDALL